MAKEKTERKPKNLHSGHRERTKKQLLEGGFNDTTPSHVLLETLLYFSVPQRDTNPLAHQLLNTFGNIGSVLSAPRAELLKIKGITDNTVSLFRIMAAVERRAMLEENARNDSVTTYDEVGAYLVRQFANIREENVGILFMKGSGKIVMFDFVGGGDLATVGINTRRIVELSVKCDATMAVLCHNHPSGVALPSPRDIEITKGLISTLNNLGIRLVDHVIVSGRDFVSLAQTSEYSHLF